MSKPVGYRVVCKSCGWEFAKGKTQSFPDMPSTCEKCKGDIDTVGYYEDDGKGFNYECTIFCKETGVVVRDGCTLSNEDIKQPQNKVIENLKFTLASCLMRMIGIDKNNLNDKNIQRLLRRD